ncbi:MAG: hypothetical protein J6Y25_04520 [Elusimicrobiaceae bacterium]|nr:hypothetical protein [Elusimicrobiaceae bacterium]
MTKPNQATIYRKRQVLTAKQLTKSLGEYGSQEGLVPFDENGQADTSHALPLGTKTNPFGNAYFKGFNLYTTVEVQVLVTAGKIGATDRFVFWNLDTNTLNAWNGSEIVSLAGGSNSMDYLFGDGSDGDVTMVADGSYDRMKNFENFTLNSGITLSKTTAGSPLFIRCTGTCTINGTINLSGKGFAGGTNYEECGKGYPADLREYDYVLSGIGATNLSSGGSMDLNAAEVALASLNFDQIPWCGGGGGGGQYIKSEIATRYTAGGCGAGAGGKGYSYSNYSLSQDVKYASGGTGGGGLIIIARRIVIAGTLTLTGTNGGTQTYSSSGRYLYAQGGGGGGGCAAFIGNEISITGSINCAGGSAGGSGAQAGGAGGYIQLVI